MTFALQHPLLWGRPALLRVSLAFVASLALVPAAQAAEPALDSSAPPLTVCLNKDNAPFSYKKEGREGGFDVSVTEALARQLGRPLEIKWYEKERRKLGAVSVKASALVTAGVCQLVGGYPLMQASLERPAQGESTTLPPVDGMSVESRKASWTGSALLASQAYHFAGVTPIFGPTVKLASLSSLDELSAYKIGGRPASIGDLIGMAYKQGKLAQQLIRIDIQQDTLTQLAAGDYDVSILEMHQFDLYRQKNPNTPLRDSGLILPVGFNLGYVSTATHAELLQQVDKALSVMAQSGALEAAARQNELTYGAPQHPAVRTGLGLEKIAQ